MSLMTALAVATPISVLSSHFDDDLPLPNIYWCTIHNHDGRVLHTYQAADFTAAALAKVHGWCHDYHGFRPYRSCSRVKMRRLKLGDILENPAAYDAALAMAESRCESDVVKALLALPAWISRQTCVPLPIADARRADELWARLGAEFEQLNLRTA